MTAIVINMQDYKDQGMQDAGQVKKQLSEFVSRLFGQGLLLKSVSSEPGGNITVKLQCENGVEAFVIKDRAGKEQFNLKM